MSHDGECATVTRNRAIQTGAGSTAHVYSLLPKLFIGNTRLKDSPVRPQGPQKKAIYDIQVLSCWTNLMKSYFGTRDPILR